MVKKNTKRVVNMKVLPGEPTDGSGRVCIHLFVPDPDGPFVEPCVMHPTTDADGRSRLDSRPTRGRLACDPKRTVAVVVKKGVTTVTLRTDSPHAVTCPRCKASRSYEIMMAGDNPTGGIAKNEVK